MNETKKQDFTAEDAPEITRQRFMSEAGRFFDEINEKKMGVIMMVNTPEAHEQRVYGNFGIEFLLQSILNIRDAMPAEVRSRIDIYLDGKDI